MAVKASFTITLMKVPDMQDYYTKKQTDAAIEVSSDRITANVSSLETITNDIDEKYNERIEKAETVIEQLSNSIASLVVDDNGSSLMQQTSNGWIFSIGETLNNLQKVTDDLKELSGNVDSQGGNITSIQNAIKGLEELNSYIRITTSGDQPAIELGNSSSFKVVITNTDIKFMDGTTVPAYVTNKMLKIGKAEVEDELSFGSFAFVERSNGNLGLIYKGV